MYEKAYFKVGNVDDYDAVKEAIKKTNINWQWYDLIDNNGNLDTMAANFNDLENISNTLLLIVTGASFVILFLIFIFGSRTERMRLVFCYHLELPRERYSCRF